MWVDQLERVYLISTTLWFRVEMETPFSHGTVAGGGIGDPRTIFTR